jgi:hypothetical protein
MKEKIKGLQSSNIVLESKQMKAAIHSEIKENSDAIMGNKYFEEKQNNMASLNSCLLNSIKTQYQISRKKSIVHKYALRWLSIVKERRLKKENDQFFNQDKLDTEVET